MIHNLRTTVAIDNAAFGAFFDMHDARYYQLGLMRPVV